MTGNDQVTVAPSFGRALALSYSVLIFFCVAILAAGWRNMTAGLICHFVFWLGLVAPFVLALVVQWQYTLVVSSAGVRAVGIGKETWMKWDEIPFHRQLTWPHWSVINRNTRRPEIELIAPPLILLDDQTVIALNEFLQRYAPADNAYRQAVGKSSRVKKLLLRRDTESKREAM